MYEKYCQKSKKHKRKRKEREREGGERERANERKKKVTLNYLIDLFLQFFISPVQPLFLLVDVHLDDLDPTDDLGGLDLLLPDAGQGFRDAIGIERPGEKNFLVRANNFISVEC